MTFVAKFTPFHDITALQGRVNRIFDDMLRGNRDEPTALWTPAVDILETPDSLVVKLEAPGLDRKNLDVRLENNVLTIRGERKFERESDAENYHRVERAYGTFSRSFVLPVVVDQDKIAADYRDGILKITLPKREQAKTRRIEIAS